MRSPRCPTDRRTGPSTPQSPVAMTFTGGTTGRPKGAVVSHTARYVSAASTAREHQVTEQDVVGVVVPMFHAVGLMIWYQAAILRGCTAVILRKWDPAEFIAATERHRISSVFLVPVQVRDLLPLPGLRPETASFAQEHRRRGRPDPARPDRGVPRRAAALRLHRPLRPVRDRPAHDPQTLGNGGTRRHRRPSRGGRGTPDRGRRREPGPDRGRSANW